MNTTAIKPNQREADIDTKLAELWEEAARLNRTLEDIRQALHDTLGLTERIGRYGKKLYSESLTEVTKLATLAVEDGTIASYDKARILAVIDKVGRINAKLNQIAGEVYPLNGEYEEKRWSRFFLVLNTNGHIHSSMSCQTCYFDTRFAWLPELSGLSEKDAVEAQGSILCSVCFPSAPLDWTNGISKVAQAAKDARAAEKEARDAVKAEKAIFAPDGAILRGYGRYGGEIRTLVTARREMMGAFKDRLFYGDDDGERYEFAVRMAEAIAHKTGEDQEELLTQAEIKAEKSYKREMG